MSEEKKEEECMSCAEKAKLGAIGLLKGIFYGPADDKTKADRLSICKACKATDTKGERLFREIDGKMYCGEKKFKKLWRDETRDGCGCNLDFKTGRKEAHCPLGLWDTVKVEDKQDIIYDDPKKPDTYKVIGGDLQVFSIAWKPCDLIMNTPALAAAKEANSGRKITWTVPQRFMDWAKLFPEADELMPQEIQNRPFNQSYVLPSQMRGDSKQRIYAGLCGGLEPKYPEIEINPKSIQWVSHAQGFERETTVLICPSEEFTFQTLTLRRWLEIEDFFLNQGYGVVLYDYDSDGSNLKKFRAMKYFGMTPAEQAAMVYKSNLVIGVNRDLLHLAGVMQKPGLALCGPYSGFEEFSWYNTVKYIQADLHCTGCQLDPSKGYSRLCNTACEALVSHMPLKMITDKAQEILEFNHGS